MGLPRLVLRDSAIGHFAQSELAGMSSRRPLMEASRTRYAQHEFFRL